MHVRLRDVIDGDLPLFFAHRQDPVAAQMAAFGTADADADAFSARWKSLAGTTLQKTVLADDAVAGFAATFLRDGKPQVTYWIDRAFWGRGVATAALAELLRLMPARPIFASAAKDNAASLRVLTKCGFVVTGSHLDYAEARGHEIEEVLLELRS